MPHLVRFGNHEVDLRSEEVRRDGVKQKLQRQPFLVLAALLERPGEVVTREQLQKILWPEDTFVDFDHSLNKAVSTLRTVLGDSSQHPRFIETVPGRGYRFIAPIRTPDPKSALPLRWVVAAVAALAVLLLLSFHDGLRKRVLGRPATDKVSSIAVLPLDNLSADPDQDYLAEGVTETLITELSQLGDWRVISRQSVMQYRNSHKTIGEIGRELNVDAVVEGSVAREGVRVRVTAQLLRTDPEEHLWAKSYTRNLSDILSLQAEVVRAIAAEVNLAVRPQAEARLERPRPIAPEAHEAYLRARYYFNQYSPEGFQKGLEYLQKALDIDASYAPAWAALVPTYGGPAYWGLRRPRDIIPKAREAALKAVELDDSLAEARGHLGAVKTYLDWDWSAGEREFRRALELNPNSSQSRLDYALLLGSLGRLDEAMAQIKLGRDADPLNPIPGAVTGWLYYVSEQHREAEQQLRHIVEIAPAAGSPHAHDLH